MEAGGAEEALQGRLPAEVSAPDAAGAAGQGCPAIPLRWRTAAFLQELPCCRIQGEASTAIASHSVIITAVLHGAVTALRACQTI